MFLMATMMSLLSIPCRATVPMPIRTFEAAAAFSVFPTSLLCSHRPRDLPRRRGSSLSPTPVSMCIRPHHAVLHGRHEWTHQYPFHHHRRQLFGWQPKETTTQKRRRHYFTSISSTNDPSAAETSSSLLSAADFPTSQYALPSPIPSIQTDLPIGQRIVAIGDVHGDLNALTQLCIAGQIMDPQSTSQNPIWIGGTTVVIQIGDVLDRGDEELACLRLLSSLSHQAKDVGGSLTLLYGNHEIMNAVGLFQYATYKGNMEFESVVGAKLDSQLGRTDWRVRYGNREPSRWAMFEPGVGLLTECTLAKMQVALVVGRTCFVHAGLTAEHLRQQGGVEGINEKAREWISQAHHPDQSNIFDEHQSSVKDNRAYAQERTKSMIKTLPNSLGAELNGPIWMRDYSKPIDAPPSNPMAQTMIGEALEELGHDVQRMVVGHTPQYRINSALNGRVWRIDVGASSGVKSGRPEVLEIIHRGDKDGEDDLVRVLTAGGERIWGERRECFEDFGGEFTPW